MIRRIGFGFVASLCALAFNYGHSVPSDFETARTYPTIDTVAPPKYCLDQISIFDYSDLPPGWWCQKPVDLYVILLHRIGACESSGDVDGVLRYRQPNLYGSTASGAYQILRGTWADWQATFRPDLHYRRAMDAPPQVQDEIAMDALKAYGTRPWSPSRKCWR